jgi:phage-related minor tail protein
MIDLGKLGFDLVLNKNGWNKDFTEADKDIETHESKWKSMASNIGGGIKMGVIGAVVGITAAVGAMAVDGAKSAIELQDHMAKFQSATGSTAEDADKVKRTIQDLYKVNEDSYEDLASTATALSNNMGMSADDIKKYAQSYLNYAKVTGQANEDAVGAIDDLGDAWGLTADESVSSMDKLLVLNQEYGMSVQDSQAALTKMAPSAKAMGMSMDEASGYLAMFAQTGIDAGTASGAFTKALQAVKSPKELQKIISDIQKCEDPMKRAQMASELFGAKAGPQMAQALGESDVSIEAFIENMNKTDGAVTKASDNYDKSLKVQLALMKKQFSGLFEELAERLMPIINTLLDWVIKHMPEIQAILSTVFNAVGDVLGLFIGIIKSVYDTFTDWFNGTSESSQQFKQMFIAFGDWFKEIFGMLKEIVMQVLKIMIDLWKKYGDDIMNIVKPIFQTLKMYLEGVMENIKLVIKAVLQVLKGDWSGAWNTVKEIFSNTFETMKNILPNLLDGLFAVLKGAFHVLHDIGKQLFSSIWDGMKNIWSDIQNWVGNKVSWLTDKLSFWKKGQGQMSGGSSSYGIDGSHANGLDYVPFNGYIAELHKGERVLTAEENQGYSNGGNGGLSVSIQNFINNRKQDVQAFAEELEFYRRQVEIGRGGTY